VRSPLNDDCDYFLEEESTKNSDTSGDLTRRNGDCKANMGCDISGFFGII